MATIYSKKIANLHAYKEQDGLEDVAFKATLEFIATDEDTGQQVSTEEIFFLSPPDPSTFTSFQNLTEEQVISWISADEDRLKAVVDGKLLRAINRLQQKVEKPWVTDILAQE